MQLYGATSLGQTVAASGICAQSPERTFRFTIGADGGVLTITQPQVTPAGKAQRCGAAQAAPWAACRPRPGRR